MKKLREGLSIVLLVLLVNRKMLLIGLFSAVGIGAITFTAVSLWNNPNIQLFQGEPPAPRLPIHNRAEDVPDSDLQAPLRKGWFALDEPSAPERRQPFDVDENTPFAAKMRVMASVYFSLNDGSGEDARRIFVQRGETIDAPLPPTREGYRFRHWAMTSENSVPFDFAQPIAASMTLYAQWRRFPPETSALNALDEFLARYGNALAVHFENIETGFIYQYNAERVFAGASVPKAFFSMYIYQKADRNETDLDDSYRFPPGGRLTQREMLRRNLVYSCNDSTIGLRDARGTAGYRQWVEALGADPGRVWNSIMGSRLCAAETAIFARAIYEYIESDAAHSDEFKGHLLNNQIPFIVSDNYPVASKTGWTSVVFHDMAIVYAPSPYILIILSAGGNQARFAQISGLFEEFNATWFAP